MASHRNSFAESWISFQHPAEELLSPKQPVPSPTLSFNDQSSDDASINVFHMYRPIRLVKGLGGKQQQKSRVRNRPALPDSFLKLSDDEGSNPWKRVEASMKTGRGRKEEDSFDDTFVPSRRDSAVDIFQALYDTTGSSSSEGHENCNDTKELEESVPEARTAFRSSLATCSNPKDDSLPPNQSEQKGWSTPLVDAHRANQRKLSNSGDSLRRLPSTFRSPLRKERSNTVNNSSSSASMRPLESSTFMSFSPKKSINRTDNPPDSAILHIRLPSISLLTTSDQSEKKKTTKANQLAEKNLAIISEDPKAKDVGTVMDGLFGISREQSKAIRCGYAGVGIAKDKKSWKAIEDYQTLLPQGQRSSIYNYQHRNSGTRRRRNSSSVSTVPASPSSPIPTTRKDQPSLPTTTQQPQQQRRRKGPPPPLDLSKVSSHTLGTLSAKTPKQQHKKARSIASDTSKSAARTTPVVKSGKKSRTAFSRGDKAKSEKVPPVPALPERMNPLQGEIERRAMFTQFPPSHDQVHPKGGKMSLRGLLRSVKSLSNLKVDTKCSLLNVE